MNKNIKHKIIKLIKSKQFIIGSVTVIVVALIGSFAYSSHLKNIDTKNTVSNINQNNSVNQNLADNKNNIKDDKAKELEQDKAKKEEEVKKQEEAKKEEELKKEEAKKQEEQKKEEASNVEKTKENNDSKKQESNDNDKVQKNDANSENNTSQNVEKNNNQDSTNTESQASTAKPSEEKQQQETKPVYTEGTIPSYISKSMTAQSTDQIIAVVANGGSSAQISLLEKQNGIWNTILQTNGFVGSQGVGQASEDVSRTPIGSYSLGFAFGIGGNIGTQLPYRQITQNSYWISDVNNSNYNTWQEGNFNGNGNEHLADYPNEYRYAITLNYNNGVGAGSAFFLHCSNGRPTAGCISVPTNIMQTLITRIHQGAHIINVNNANELVNY